MNKESTKEIEEFIQAYLADNVIMMKKLLGLSTDIDFDDEYTYIFSLLKLGRVHLLERMDGRELTKDIPIKGNGNYVNVNYYAQQLLDNYQSKKNKDEGERE